MSNEDIALHDHSIAKDNRVYSQTLNMRIIKVHSANWRQGAAMLTVASLRKLTRNYCVADQLSHPHVEVVYTAQDVKEPHVWALMYR